jgi:hypothetical protein
MGSIFHGRKPGFARLDSRGRLSPHTQNPNSRGGCRYVGLSAQCFSYCSKMKLSVMPAM